jgi:hypothetical protein
MTPRTIPTLAALLAILCQSACVRPATAPVENWGGPPDPCAWELAEIEHATFGDQANVAVRVYLTCLLDNEVRPPIDLESRVSEELMRNPYPATRRARNDVLSHFFDNTQMKEMPANIPEMYSYIALLEDQALAARAVGDVELAIAAEARATKIRTLQPILEDIEG